MPEVRACPEPTCDAPAEVVDRWVLPSTSGPVEQVKTRCLDGHCFTPLVDALAGARLGPQHRSSVRFIRP